MLFHFISFSVFPQKKRLQHDFRVFVVAWTDRWVVRWSFRSFYEFSSSRGFQTFFLYSLLFFYYSCVFRSSSPVPRERFSNMSSECVWAASSIQISFNYDVYRENEINSKRLHYIVQPNLATYDASTMLVFFFCTTVSCCWRCGVPMMWNLICYQKRRRCDDGWTTTACANARLSTRKRKMRSQSFIIGCRLLLKATKKPLLFSTSFVKTKIAWKVFHLMMFQFTLPISYYVTTTTSHFLLIYYYCLLITLANNFLCRDLQDFLNLRLVWLRFNNKIIIMFSYFQSIYFFFVSFIFRLLVSLRNSPSDPSRLIRERKEKLDQ